LHPPLVLATIVLTSIFSPLVQASEIADLVRDMRSVLMEELDSGIPEADVSPVPSPIPSGPKGAPPSGSTSSTYQQMLAKARAAKDRK
jgi:hypothetical protein